MLLSSVYELRCRVLYIHRCELILYNSILHLATIATIPLTHVFYYTIPSDTHKVNQITIWSRRVNSNTCTDSFLSLHLPATAHPGIGCWFRTNTTAKWLLHAFIIGIFVIFLKLWKLILVDHVCESVISHFWFDSAIKIQNCSKTVVFQIVQLPCMWQPLWQIAYWYKYGYYLC